MKPTALAISALSLMALSAIPAGAKQYIPPGIASPDRVETRLGTLKFFDGFSLTERGTVLS